jgi:hypothetical protein
MSDGRAIGMIGLSRPRAIGEPSGWYWSWQPEPILLGSGQRVFQKSAYRRPTGAKKRMVAFRKAYEREYGRYCSGAPEIGHLPHHLTSPRRFLTVDHIIPLAVGGLTVKSNLRVVCDKANARLNSFHYRASLGHEETQ